MRSRDPYPSLRANLSDEDSHEGRPEAIISIAVGGMSGFVMGLLLRGGFFLAGLFVVMTLAAGWIGWWARKVVRG